MVRDILQGLQDVLKTSTVTYGVINVILLLGLVFILAVQNGNTCTNRKKLRHLRRIGLSTSNMADQYESKYDAPEGTTPEGPIRIKAICVHPIKSCGRIELNRALLTKTGLMYDRCFALATELGKNNPAMESKWRFICQRTKPTMSQIKTELWLPHKESNQHDPLVQAGGCVVVSFPDPDGPGRFDSLKKLFQTGKRFAKPEVQFIVPLQPTPAMINEYGIQYKTFGIHSRDAKGLDMGAIPSVAEALPKLKKYLRIANDQNLTLLRCTSDTLVRTDKNLAPLEHIGTPSVHGYTDQQPININSLSSVHAVSALLPTENQPLNAFRFRANIWITGAPAFDEESWKRYRILPKGSDAEPRADVALTVSVVCRTSRCTMPNVNPETGVPSADNPPAEKKRGKPQPSATLIKYRTVEDGNKSALGYIGMHCVPEDRALQVAEELEKGLYVAVGDEIEVLERGEHLYGSTANDY
ncbi:molybdopterin cofactor sulfurase [Aspergillus nomiae NRRL 13137]|uniref:Molybdopterin cofactor sulfurase n=1 Tax=Aspergillus nomiae NRRL (strain ATCC 15546 / NRRL 13137 / CBS 260.88 / M93) TaxID=1509407 RepID=A0A0L1JAX9_ASPN3|nr:molybdopterin cofactor sulfurase [Aspergillus nomiae NRRL 13137]KNG88877.1 molybdopterin cofactor sulfurase [Aspergillus nomiae NRRL 13137]